MVRRESLRQELSFLMKHLGPPLAPEHIAWGFRGMPTRPTNITKAASKAVKTHVDHGFHATVQAVQQDTGASKQAASKAVEAVYADLKRQVLNKSTTGVNNSRAGS